MARGFRGRENEATEHASEAVGGGESQTGGDVDSAPGIIPGGTPSGAPPNGEDAVEVSGAESGGGDGKTIRTEAEKADTFKRLASIRASNALDALRGLGHLANAKQYKFEKEQIDRMVSALRASVDAIEKSFAAELIPRAEGERRKRGDRQLSFRI